MTLDFRYFLTLIGFLALASLVVFAGPADQRASTPHVGVASATHVVMFEHDVDVDALLNRLDAEFGARPQFIYRHALKGASMHIPDEFVADVAAFDGVSLVEGNGAVVFTAFPVDQEVQGWSERSGLGASHPFADITGSGGDLNVDIAIIDSGVNGLHPDINLHAAVNCAPAGGGTFTCTSVTPAASVDLLGHGTRVAGVAAARDNGFGIVGMAPGARIWSARLIGDDPRLIGDTSFGEIGIFTTPAANIAALIAAIDWVTSNTSEIEVANMSVGIVDSGSDIFRTAIQNSVATGITYFVSAGNSLVDIYGPDGAFGGGDDVEPAAFPEVATISGYTDTDGLPGGLGGTTAFGEADDTFWNAVTHPVFVDYGVPVGSNFSAAVDDSNPVTSPGAAIDFAMPAVDIMSTCVPDAVGDDIDFARPDCLANVDDQGGNYGRASGTSFSAPQAAGLAALLIVRNGTRDINGDTFVDADDTYALRQALIDLAVAQNNAEFGLVQPAGDFDSNPEPLGSAGMMLNFDVTSFSLAGTGSSQQVVVDTPYLPLGKPETVQLNLVHDSTKFTIGNPQCVGAYIGGIPFGPTANSGGTGTVIGCSLVGGPVADGGSVLTFDVVAANNGTQSFTLDGSSLPEGSGFVDSGTLLMNANAPSFNIDFTAIIDGSFDLQAVSGQAALTLIAPSSAAIPVSGAASQNVVGPYDPASGTFSISVIEPGDYDVQADATGFISRLYKTVTVDSSGVVTNAPSTSTTLRGGDADGDGDVDSGDMAILLASFSAEPTDRLNGGSDVVDINGDNFVTGIDISILISNFGPSTTDGVEDWDAP